MPRSSVAIGTSPAIFLPLAPRSSSSTPRWRCGGCAISEGLARVGHDAPRKPVALGGNFDLVNVQDLVAKRSLAPGEPFAALGLDTIDRELERLYAMAGQSLTLRFHSPLRLERPGSEAQSGHRYADAAGLHVGQFLRTVQKRLAAIGLRRRDHNTDTDTGAEAPFDDSAITLLANRLTWLDLEYGRRDERKSLGARSGGSPSPCTTRSPSRR